MSKRKLKVIFVLCLILAGFSPLTVLEVVRGRTGEILYRQPVRVGAEFKLVFTHSVTLRPIEETYRVTPDRKMAIVSMVFDDNGPNLPAYPEGSTRWIFEPGRWRVVGYDTVLPEIPLLVGKYVANHMLLVGDRQVALTQVAGPGQQVRIRAARVSLWEFYWGGGAAWLRWTKEWRQLINWN